MITLGALMGFFLLSSGTVASHPLVYAIDASSPVGHVDATPVVAPKMLTLPGYPVTLTAYNAVPEQTDSTPFETASGAYSMVAASKERDASCKATKKRT